MAEILREYEEREDTPKETLENTQVIQFYKDMCLGLRKHFIPIGFIESWADTIPEDSPAKETVDTVIDLLIKSWLAVSEDSDEEEPEEETH